MSNREDLGREIARRRLTTALLAFLVLVGVLAKLAAISRDYKRAIYEAERGNSRAVERLIGERGTIYRRDAIRPKYPHFWDEYGAE